MENVNSCQWSRTGILDLGASLVLLKPVEDLGEDFDELVEWTSNQTLVLHSLDEIDFLAVKFLNFSPVARVLEACGSVQLSLEESKVLLLDGVNGAEDVPVNVGGARWSGERSLVDPSVPAVKCHEEVSDGHKINGWALGRNIIQLHGLEENVDDSLLSIGQLGSRVLDGEKDSERSGGEISILNVLRCVVDLELKVLSLTINGVLGASTHLHVGGSPLGVSSKHALAEHGLEAKSSIFAIHDHVVQLDGLSIESPADFLSIWVDSLGIVVLPRPDFVLVGLLESVLFGVSGN